MHITQGWEHRQVQKKVKYKVGSEYKYVKESTSKHNYKEGCTNKHLNMRFLCIFPPGAYLAGWGRGGGRSWVDLQQGADHHDVEETHADLDGDEGAESSSHLGGREKEVAEDDIEHLGGCNLAYEDRTGQTEGGGTQAGQTSSWVVWCTARRS